MRELYDEFLPRISVEELKERVVGLSSREHGQAFANYHRAAQYVRDFLTADGIPEVEMIEVPADGKTCFMDKRMPLAWDATVGKLTWLRPESQGGEMVLADYTVEPLNLIKGSVATPPGGLVTRVITEEQFLAGEDARGALVLLAPSTRPTPGSISPVLDRGGLGVVADFITNRYGAPDCVYWANAATDAGDWHVTLQDRPFIGFDVSPLVGEEMRKAAAFGAMKVRVECDGRRYPGVFHVVTARLPGRRPEELWAMAHLYEPFTNDDASGVVAASTALKLLQAKGTPEYSVRVVFSAEFYGFSAYAAMRGGDLHGQVVGGINLDSIGGSEGRPTMVIEAPGHTPSAVNAVLKRGFEECQDRMSLEWAGQRFGYGDDLQLSDSTVGLTTCWLYSHRLAFHHNSYLCRPDFMDFENYARAVAFTAAFLWEAANSEVPAAAPPMAEPAPIHSKWRDYAARMVFARATVGFPHALEKVPREQRIALPNSINYGPLANVLSNMDGAKDVARLLREAETERNDEYTEAQVKKYIDTLDFLADAGYLTVLRRPELGPDEIGAALEALGLRGDELLLVHASLSKCGHVRGGAQTIIDTIRGHVGTALFTTFTRPYTYLGGVARDRRFRPFDPTKPEQVSTGAIGKAALGYPEVVRSAHVSHSWAGFGPLAHTCLDAHGLFDAPTGETSPLAKAWELGGKVLFFGTGLAPSTFLHYLEDQARLPYLSTAVCQAVRPDGSIEIGCVPRHLPGHRDFYGAGADTCKFYTRARERGLEVREVPLGEARLQLIDLRQLKEIGMELIAEDPRILLCDDPECLFCGKY